MLHRLACACMFSLLWWAALAAAQPADPGTGASTAPGSAQGLGTADERDAILLNFESADILEVIYTFAAALGLNYWLDPRV